MKPVEELDKDSIIDDSVFEEIFAVGDTIKRERLKAKLLARAGELRIKGTFEKLLKAYEYEAKKNTTLLEHWTNFTGPYDRMKCGPWIADDSGVRMYSMKNGMSDMVACDHPILPVQRMINLQTGEEQITLAFSRCGQWKEVTVPKTTIAKRALITGLSGQSILVTDDNASLLMRYLKDVESLNEDAIPLKQSSSKMGWMSDGTFLPYDTEIVFDSAARFGRVYKAIRAHGSKDIWYEHVRALRASGRLEINFMLAVSFAAVLIPVVNALPFMVDLWGETGGGKTVTLMLAASVWANPASGEYIRDYASTDTGFEALADFLNNLPLILDDTSKMSEPVKKRIEEISYNLNSGKGKTRSNKSLGINRESTWGLITMTCGEKPFVSMVNQGGAINRTLEIESQLNIFKNPQETVRIIRDNYGHAGKDFVELVKSLGAEEIRRIQENFQQEIALDGKAEKQSISLSVIMTADKLIDDYLFKDGRHMNLTETVKLLATQKELSDNERCYEYILSQVDMNGFHFNPDVNATQWGWKEKDDKHVVFYSQALEDVCSAGGFSKRAFLSWARRNGIVTPGNDGKSSKSMWVDGKKTRCIYIKMPDDKETAEGDSGFVEVDPEQEELPFLD